jgi:signal peptidase I
VTKKKVIFSLIAGIMLGLSITALAFGLFSKDYFALRTHGGSMYPTFQDNDLVIFKKVKEPQIGDFIVFHIPNGWEKAWKGREDPDFLKRVSMLPGDTLTWDGSSWYRNGVHLSSIRTGKCLPPSPFKYTLKEGEYFVTGDVVGKKTLDSREAFCRSLDYLVQAKDVKHFGKIHKIL